MYMWVLQQRHTLPLAEHRRDQESSVQSTPDMFYSGGMGLMRQLPESGSVPHKGWKALCDTEAPSGTCLINPTQNILAKD